MEVEYKVGDKVKFVKTGKIGWESQEWYKRDKLLLGAEYVVNHIMGDGGTALDGGGFFHHHLHFELVKE